MGETVPNATKLDMKKLEEHSPVKAVTLQKKSTTLLDWLIIIISILLVAVIGLIVYFSINPIT